MDGLILFWVIQIMHTLRFVRFPETRKECCCTSPEANHSMMKVCVKVAMEANHRSFGGFHSSWSNRCVLKSAALVCRPCSPAFCLIWKRFMCVYMHIYICIYIYIHIYICQEVTRLRSNNSVRYIRYTLQPKLRRRAWLLGSSSSQHPACQQSSWGASDAGSQNSESNAEETHKAIFMG